MGKADEPPSHGLCGRVISRNNNVKLIKYTGLGQLSPRQMPPGQLPLQIPPGTITPWTITPWTTAPRQLPPGQLPPDYCPQTINPPRKLPLRTIALQTTAPWTVAPLGCLYNYMDIRKFHCFFFPNGYFSFHSESEDYAN